MGFSDPGTPCGDAGIECVEDDACDGAGVCVDAGFSALGAECGSASDSTCDGRDTCDGAGTCQDNIAPSGSVCGALSSDCSTGDFCDGAGACLEADRVPAGSACGAAPRRMPPSRLIPANGADLP